VFAVVGAIALQGVRLAAPTLGESCAVIGLGLIGLLAVQLLSANGCRVLGIDPDARKRELARQFGADVVAVERGEEALAVAESFSNGVGIDAVLITAATDSSEPVTQAARMCRKRGRIVLVGVAGLSLDRSEFYQKELSFQVSCSYGPGRYDPEYEERGNDYPPGFVRWTEQRNFQAVLEMMRSRRLDVRPLISHRFALDAAPAAYELLANGAEPYVGILLEYPVAASGNAPRDIQTAAALVPGALTTVPGVALVGAGNYAMRVLVPAFAATGVHLRGVASSGGVSAAHCARKFGFERATTDTGVLIASPDVDAVIIATRHDSHASLTIRALEAGKHVFVEKPLALTAIEVDAIAHAWEQAGAGGRHPLLAVGFNRRFAPLVVRMKALLAGVREPKNFIVTVNAGEVPAAHWTRDRRVGGGRITGEACHFVDLLRFLAGQAIVAAGMQTLGGAVASGSQDSATIQLRFADGSLGTIHYIASGHRAFPKERIEVFCGGRVLQLDNFRRLRGYGWPDFRVARQWQQDKGQKALAEAFVGAIQRGGEPPIPFSEVIEVSRVVVSLSEGGTV
jgi:predicted dehydrogenase